MLRTLRRDRLKLQVIVAVIVVVLTLAACSVTGSPSPSPKSPPSTVSADPRQVDDAGRALPFVTPFRNRWNSNNDGTPYEPCTAVSRDVLLEAGLLPETVEDVAKSDFQTARGCRWTFQDDGKSSLSQSAANLAQPESGISGYKAKNARVMRWYPDEEIEGRRVVVGSLTPMGCAASVQSGDALVGTTIVRIGAHKPPIEQICERAIEFLKATINRIPV